MPAQPYPYLVLSDGTDTVTFADGLGGITNWPPVRGQWAPQVAGIRFSQLGGYGPYADVNEELRHNIRDTSADGCYGRLETLARLLDKADRWWLRNEPIAAVLLKYAPQGSLVASTAAPYQVVVLGRSGEDNLSGVALPSDTNDAGMLFEIRDVALRPRRRGPWLLAAESSNSPTAANAAVATCTYGTAANTYSPLAIEIRSLPTAAAGTHPQGTLFYADAANHLEVFDASSLGGTGYTTASDSGNNPQGSGILIYTPTGTAAADTTLQTFGSLDAAAQTIAVYAVMRNNSTTRSYTVQALTSMPRASGGVYVGQNVSAGATVPPSNQKPQIVYLGMLVSRAGHAAIGLRCQVDSTAGSGTLDIDYLVIVALDNLACGVVLNQALSLSNFNSATSSGGTLRFDSRALSDQTPRVIFTANSLTLTTGYIGDAAIQMRGSIVACLWIATGGVNGVSQANFWRYSDAAGSVVGPITYQAFRNVASLTPR